MAKAATANPAKRGPIEILLPGKFHASEVPADSGELWLVLYREGGSYHAQIRPIRISPCEDAADVGKCVSSDLSDSVVLFVKGLRAPSKNPVETVRGAPLLLYPGQEASFQLPNGEWSNIAALGNAKELEHGTGEVARVIASYQLSLRRGPEFHPRQMLGPFSVDSDSHPPTIEWADGHVDLLIERTSFDVVEYMLYLSSKAQFPDLLKLVASRTHVGC